MKLVLLIKKTSLPILPPVNCKGKPLTGLTLLDYILCALSGWTSDFQSTKLLTR